MTEIHQRHIRFTHIYATFIIAVMALLTAGCHSSRSGVVTGGDYNIADSEPLSKKTLDELFVNLENSYSEWDGVKMPVTLNLISPKNMSIGGTLTMERDRSVHLSFRFFGMEVASVMVTSDSIYAAYKVEKIYFAESISDLLGGFPATVGNVQDLLLGRPFMLGENSISRGLCQLSGTGAAWTISPDRNPMGMSYDFTIDTPTGNVELLTVNLPSRQPIVADYSDFAISETGPMAGVTAISAKSGNTRFAAEITLNPRKAEWGKGLGKTWSVPKGYRRVLAADILKKLKVGSAN